MNRFVGIDLGTTNSTISVSHLTARGDVQPKTLEVTQVQENGINLVQDTLLPSVLYIDDEKNAYIGQFAKKMVGFYPKRVIKEAKRFIGDEVSWKVDEDSYRPEVVSHYVLRTLKKQVEEFYIGDKIDSVVITVPANFNFQQDKATRLAAQLAGFEKDKIHTIPEPTAALVDFINEERSIDNNARRIQLNAKPKNLLVFDLGGGTCDVSILSVSESSTGQIDIEELSISQYTELGGIDFDKKISNFLLVKLLKDKGITGQELKRKFDEAVLSKLWESLIDFAEKAKMFFSTRIETTLLNRGQSYHDCKTQFDSLVFTLMISDQLPAELATLVSISKSDYDSVVADLLYSEKSTGKNIESPILNALATARSGAMKKSDIDAVFLVGGMTMYPTIQERIYEIFEMKVRPVRSLNPMHAVSRGAAVYHYYINQINLTKYINNKQTVPNNVFIHVTGGHAVPLLTKGEKVPCTRYFTDSENSEHKFFVTGPSSMSTVNSMELELFTAPSADSLLDVKTLKNAFINFKRPVRVGSRLFIKIECNEERDVTVKAWLKDDETEVIDVNVGSHEFTEEELKQIKLRHENINKL